MDVCMTHGNDHTAAWSCPRVGARHSGAAPWIPAVPGDVLVHDRRPSVVVTAADVHRGYVRDGGYTGQLCGLYLVHPIFVVPRNRYRVGDPTRADESWWDSADRRWLVPGEIRDTWGVLDHEVEDWIGGGSPDPDPVSWWLGRIASRTDRERAEASRLREAVYPAECWPIAECVGEGS